MSCKFDLQQIIEGSTRITKSSETLIDLLFTNRPERIKKSYNLATGLSDHNMILFVRKLKTKIKVSANMTQEQLKIPKNQLPLLEKTIMDTDWTQHLAGNSLENSCNSFVAQLKIIINGFVRKVKCKPGHGKNLPWLNGDIWALMKKRDYALKRHFKVRKIMIDNCSLL